MQTLRNLRELHPLGFKDLKRQKIILRILFKTIFNVRYWKVSNLLEVFVTVDELSLVRVLQFVGLHVLPQGLNDDGAGLSVDAQQSGQSRVQLELRRLKGD